VDDLIAGEAEKRGTEYLRVFLRQIPWFRLFS
jgi:hypothetical protein